MALAASPWLNFDVPMGYIAGAYLAVLLLGLALAMSATALFARSLSAPIPLHVPKHRQALGMVPRDKAAATSMRMFARYRNEAVQALDNIPRRA